MKIVTLRHAYQPDLQGMERPRIEEVYHDTLQKAIDQIQEWDSEIYYLAHNEYTRPTYIVVEDVDADYVEGGRFEDMSNYDWDEDMECGTCGECNTCIRIMIEQDRQYLLNAALYKS
ncbi:hypothetical protein Rctr71_033 [Virus Rctr71]|nr:hypothetical protein Rctr71_033 [Virus Rctr71]